MYKELIAEAEKLCVAATPGPWTVEENCIIMKGSVDKVAEALHGSRPYSNAKFIARSRTLIPELATALEEQEVTHRISVNAGADALKQLRERAKRAETERDVYKAALQNWHEE